MMDGWRVSCGFSQYEFKWDQYWFCSLNFEGVLLQMGHYLLSQYIYPHGNGPEIFGGITVQCAYLDLASFKSSPTTGFG